MITNEVFNISNLRGEDIDITIDLATRVGWNVGLYDSCGFYAADHEGFFAGTLGKTVIASIFGINYGNDFSFIGRYIVDEQFRGCGYGTSLWQKAMNHLGSRPIGLNSALPMEKKYARVGFKTAHRGARFGALSHKFTPVAEGLISLNQTAFRDILKFDRKYFPVERDNFLQAWLMLPQSHGYAVVDSQGQITAYGLIRRFSTGWKIGPLFSDTPEAANLLYEALQGTLPEQEPVFLDVAMNNPYAMTLVAKNSMVKIFENVRMYKGDVPEFDLMGVYSFTSQELG